MSVSLKGLDPCRIVHANKPLRDAFNTKLVREIPRAGKYFLPNQTVILKANTNL